MSTMLCGSVSWTLTRQTRQPVLRHCSCGSGWSVPCVSIQLTLSQCGWSVPCVSIQLTLSQCGWSVPKVSIQLTLSQCFTCVSIQLTLSVSRPLRGSVSCGSGWSVPCVSIQLTLSQFSMFHRMELASSCPSRAWRSASRPWARALPKQWACTRGCAPTSTHPRLATTQSSSSPGRQEALRSAADCAGAQPRVLAALRMVVNSPPSRALTRLQAYMRQP